VWKMTEQRVYSSQGGGVGADLGRLFGKTIGSYNERERLPFHLMGGVPCMGKEGRVILRGRGEGEKEGLDQGRI